MTCCAANDVVQSAMKDVLSSTKHGREMDVFFLFLMRAGTPIRELWMFFFFLLMRAGTPIREQLDQTSHLGNPKGNHLRHTVWPSG